MRPFIAIALVAFAGSGYPTQRASADSPIVVTASEQPLNPNRCRMHSFIRGRFGGTGQPVQSKQNLAEWHIMTTHEGDPAEELQAYLYCPGFQVETLQIPNLRDVQSRLIGLELQPLDALPFVGIVVGDVIQNRDEIEVTAQFVPLWTCEFFRLPDCGLSSWHIGSAALGTDNRFRMELPDFLRDPVISSSNYRGELEFLIRDRKTTNIVFYLAPTESNSPSRRLPLAHTYLGEHSFELVSPR